MTAAIASEEKTNAAHSAWTAPIAVYTAFGVACIALLHPTALDMTRQWATSSSYAHGFVVAPIALWMILDRRKELPAPSANLWPLIPLFGAAVLWLIGRAGGLALAEQVAFVALLIAGVGVIFGTALLRVWAFPLAFLFFMVPFGEAIVPPLQTATAKAAVGVLNLVSIHTTLEGYLIKTRAGAFEVAEACAGLRFLLSALMVAALFAYFHLNTWRRRVLFFGIAIIVAIGANALRAVLLILIATVSDMRLAVGPDHLFLGLVFYGLVFLTLFWIGRKMSGPQTQVKQHPALAPRRTWRALYALPAFLALAATSAYSTVMMAAPDTLPAPPASLSLFSAPGWRILPPPQNWAPQFNNPDRIAAASYNKQENTVYFATAYYTHDRRSAEIASYANRSARNETWRHIGDIHEPIYLFGRSEKTKVELLAGPDYRRLAVVTVFWWNGDIYLDPKRLQFAQMKARLIGDNPRGGIIHIAAAYQNDPAEALRTLRAFTIDLEPFEQWLGRQGGA